MALTNSFPSGLPAGLSVADTRRIIASLIVRDTTGAPRLGIIPRHFLPLVTATSSMAYAIGAFEAAVSRTGVGVELVVNDGTTNVTTAASPAANSRIDVIWVRSRFSAAGDTSDAPEFGVTSGAAASAPTKPAIPLGALELAVATVPSSAIATNSAGIVITQTHLYTAGSGGTVAFRTVAEMTLFAAAAGQQAHVFGASTSFQHTGKAWMMTADLGTSELLHSASSPQGFTIPTGALQMAKSSSYTSPVKRRALIVVTYQWYATSSCAGYDEVKVGPTTSGTTITDRIRLHNEGVAGGHSVTLTGTALLDAGANVISLWGTAEAAPRTLMYTRINVSAL